MSYEVNSIGFFQFDNLITNRVPFGLINLVPEAEQKFSEWYSGVFWGHLQNYLINSTTENFLADIESKKLAPHTAFVILDADGKSANQIAQSLEEKGHMNVFIVRGGLHGLEQERQSSGQ